MTKGTEPKRYQRVEESGQFLGMHSSTDTGSPRASQHAATEENVIHYQGNDRANCRGADAVNALDIEARQPAIAK